MAPATPSPAEPDDLADLPVGELVQRKPKAKPKAKAKAKPAVTGVVAAAAAAGTLVATRRGRKGRR